MASVPTVIINLIIVLDCSMAARSRTENVSNDVFLPPSPSEVTTRGGKLDRSEHSYMSMASHTPSKYSTQMSLVQQMSSENPRAKEVATDSSHWASWRSTSPSPVTERSPGSIWEARSMLPILHRDMTTERRDPHGGDIKMTTRPSDITFSNRTLAERPTANQSTLKETSSAWNYLFKGEKRPEIQIPNWTVPNFTGTLPETSTSAVLRLKTSKSCLPKYVSNVNVTAWVLTWTKNYRSCTQEYKWIFTFPPEHVGFVEFHHIEIHPDDNLMITTTYQSVEYVHRNFTGSNVESFGPLLISSGEILVIKMFTPFVSQSTQLLSSFNLSFLLQASKLVPNPEVVVNHAPTQSHVTYHCDGVRPLPTTITCDGIRHCKNGEDENECPYTKEGCGDWFPYNNYCLKAAFINLPMHSCGSRMDIAPISAAKECDTNHNATLALLPDTAGIQLVASMIRKSGFLSAVVGIRKFKPSFMKVKHLYRFLWQWGEAGGSIAYEQQFLQRSGAEHDCGVLTVSPRPHIQPVSCRQLSKKVSGYICMKPKSIQSTKTKKGHGIHFRTTSQLPDPFPTKVCPDGSVVQVFDTCDWGQYDADKSVGWSPSHLPLFRCTFGPAVHYSVLCDGNDDCADASDEAGCQKPQFSPLLKSMLVCTNSQTIAAGKRCNGIADCHDGSDEEYCLSCSGMSTCPGVGCVPSYYSSLLKTCPVTISNQSFRATAHDTGSVQLDGYGLSILNPVSGDCAEDFYECFNGLCIPSFLVNNGEKDCVDGEDEHIPVFNITCPGFYRCKGTGSCVHKQHLCDMIYHCPEKDDEMFCSLTCPADHGCVCEGHAFTCSKMVDPLQHFEVRYLDVSYATGVSLEHIHVMEYLFLLNLSFCNLRNFTLTDMLQVRILDLSFNTLEELASVNPQNLPSLLHLNLSNNPLGRTLGLLFNALNEPGKIANLETLIVSGIGLKKIHNRMFSSLSKLQYLDLRNNPLHKYGKEFLWGLEVLKVMLTDNSKLCCDYFHFSDIKCHVSIDELSSCTDLLGNTALKVLFWVISFLASTGNAGVLIYIHVGDIHISVPSVKAVLKHSCASGFLMGLCLAIICVADIQFQGGYVAKEAEWKNSLICTCAGFLAFLSSEVSVLFMCLVTVESVFIMHFPFTHKFHLNSRYTNFICCVVWIIGGLLAAVPLTFEMDVYAQNDACLPLPMTQESYSGQNYVFSIFTIFNIVVLVFILIGQLLIYRVIRITRKECICQEQSIHMSIARPLFRLVCSGFYSLFVVGMMGFLSVDKNHAPSQLKMWTMIVVLTINSALYPLIFILNDLTVRWAKRNLLERQKRMLCRLQAEISTWQPTAVQELVQVCVRSKKVHGHHLMKYFQRAESQH